MSQEQINHRIVKANKELKQIESERNAISKPLEQYRERMKLYQAEIEAKEAIERRNQKIVKPVELVDKDLLDIRRKSAIVLQKWWRKTSKKLKTLARGLLAIGVEL